MSSSSQAPEVILYDYQFAPNAQKARNLLNACGIPYRYVEQPFVQPRPILTDLGVTYRRIPVNFIGKDGYCDNRVFADAVQTIFKDKALPTSPADHAYESFGYRTFWNGLCLVPAKLITKEMAEERKDLFSVFSRPDFADLRPNSLAEFAHFLDIVENDFLSHGSQFIKGDQISMADIHAVWMIKWALQTIGVNEEPGFGKQDWPRVYRWIEGLPKHDEKGDAAKIGPEEAQKVLLGASYGQPGISFDEKDPTGLKKGASVAVETNDE